MHPHVDQTDRDAIDDHSLVSPVGDNTEEMRRAPVAPEALQFRTAHPVTTTTKEF